MPLNGEAVLNEFLLIIDWLGTNPTVKALIPGKTHGPHEHHHRDDSVQPGLPD